MIRRTAEEPLDPRLSSADSICRRLMNNDLEAWPWRLNPNLLDPLFLQAETLHEYGITCRLGRFYDFRSCDDLGCRCLGICVGPLTDLLDATRALLNLAPSLETLALRGRLESLKAELAWKIDEEYRRLTQIEP